MRSAHALANALLGNVFVICDRPRRVITAFHAKPDLDFFRGTLVNEAMLILHARVKMGLQLAVTLPDLQPFFIPFCAAPLASETGAVYSTGYGSTG